MELPLPAAVARLPSAQPSTGAMPATRCCMHNTQSSWQERGALSTPLGDFARQTSDRSLRVRSHPISSMPDGG